MAGYYTYVLSSLTALTPTLKMPLSYARFLEACRGLIDDEEAAVLETLRGWDPARWLASEAPFLRQWRHFEIALRNELVRQRAVRRHVDAGKHLREDGLVDIWIAQIAVNAVRNPSLLEAERYLDEERWKKLDELCLGHHFDFDALLAYGMKLLILERWERVAAADKTKVLEETLATAS